MIGKKLKGDNAENRNDGIRNARDFDNVVGDSFELFCAIATGEGDDRTFARLHLFDVVEVLGKNGVVWRDKNRRKIRPDQSDDAMLEFGARMTFGKKIGDLFHLKRA